VQRLVRENTSWRDSFSDDVEKNFDEPPRTSTIATERAQSREKDTRARAAKLKDRRGSQRWCLSATAEWRKETCVVCVDGGACSQRIWFPKSLVRGKVGASAGAKLWHVSRKRGAIAHGAGPALGVAIVVACMARCDLMGWAVVGAVGRGSHQSVWAVWARGVCGCWRKWRAGQNQSTQSDNSDSIICKKGVTVHETHAPELVLHARCVSCLGCACVQGWLLVQSNKAERRARQSPATRTRVAPRVLMLISSLWSE